MKKELLGRNVSKFQGSVEVGVVGHKRPSAILVEGENEVAIQPVADEFDFVLDGNGFGWVCFGNGEN